MFIIIPIQLYGLRNFLLCSLSASWRFRKPQGIVPEQAWSCWSNSKSKGTEQKIQLKPAARESVFFLLLLCVILWALVDEHNIVQYIAHLIIIYYSSILYIIYYILSIIIFRASVDWRCSLLQFALFSLLILLLKYLGTM